MTDDIEIVLTNTYSSAMVAQLRHAFELFEEFNLDIEAELIGIVLDPMCSEKAEHILIQIRNGCEQIALAHGLVLSDDIPLERVLVHLDFLKQLQSVEQPQPLLAVLEADESSEIKYATIASDQMGGDIAVYLSELAEIDEVFITTLKKFLGKKEKTDVELIDPARSADLKAYFELHGSSLIANQLLAIGPVFTYSFSLLVAHVKAQLDPTYPQRYAVEIVALLMLSRDGYQHEFHVFREHSELLGLNLKQSQEIEKLLMQVLEHFNTKRMVDNEEKRLLNSVHKPRAD